MDFIFDNIIILIIAASGLARWWKATQDAKKERENPVEFESESKFESEYQYDAEELEEFIEQAERRQARAAVPPPLPVGQHQAEVKPSLPPVLQRSRKPEIEEFDPFSEADDHEKELARQAALAKRLSGLKEARKAREAPQDIRSSGPKKPRVKTPIGGLRSRLRSRQELRQAIVIKEILDKPVGLR